VSPRIIEQNFQIKLSFYFSYNLAGAICPRADHFTATIVYAKGRFSKYDHLYKFIRFFFWRWIMLLISTNNITFVNTWQIVFHFKNIFYKQIFYNRNFLFILPWLVLYKRQRCTITSTLTNKTFFNEIQMILIAKYNILTICFLHVENVSSKSIHEYLSMFE
jgi:hypothetical protein